MVFVMFCVFSKLLTFGQFKWLVHPKMKILPHVVPTLYVFICSPERKGRYLEECFNETGLSTQSPLTTIVGKNTYILW